MRSLTAKLLIAFIAVGLTTTALLAILAVLTTRGEFDDFMFSYQRSALAEQLEDYYSATGSWEGLARQLPVRRWGGPRPGPHAPPTFLLVDEFGAVVNPGHGFHMGEHIAAGSLSDGTALEVDGETVGTLFVQRSGFSFDPAAQAFIDRTSTVLAAGAAGGVLAAILLGVVLSRSLTRPLHELTSAARAVAAGELDRRVPVRTSDELGVLAEAFNQMNADLATARDRRRQLTADVAHELRTPLSVILGHSEGIHEGVLKASEDNLAVIRDEAQRLERLVEDLRMLSLVESGELPLEVAEYAPAELLEKTAASYRALANEKGVSLSVRSQENLPRIRVDADRMGQVISNLIGNAMRHTPAGGKVLLAAEAGDGSLIISVTDDGPGIDPEDLPHVFERFYRADKSRQRDGAGSGLGLAIAKSITKAQGGTIHAESNPGSGTTILLRFPAMR